MITPFAILRAIRNVPRLYRALRLSEGRVYRRFVIHVADPSGLFRDEQRRKRILDLISDSPVGLWFDSTPDGTSMVHIGARLPWEAHYLLAISVLVEVLNLAGNEVDVTVGPAITAIPAPLWRKIEVEFGV